MIKKYPLCILYILYCLFRFAQLLTEVPTVRMIEHAVCHQQLDRMGLDMASLVPGLDEKACKVANVQEQVARIVGWRLSFDAVPGVCCAFVESRILLTRLRRWQAGFTMAFYFGRLADECGHRLVLSLCCVGYLLALLWILITCRSSKGFASQAQRL